MTPVTPSPPVATEAASTETPAPPTESDALPAAAAPPAAIPSRDELVMAWGDDLMDRLSRKARARFSAARFIDVQDGTAVMALPNEPHLRRCEDLRGELENVLAARFGGSLPVRLVVDDGSSAPTLTPTTKPRPVAVDESMVADESIDLDELVDADVAEGSAVDRLTQAFPGAALVEPD